MSNNSKNKEASLIERLKCGDEAAFQQLYNIYASRIFWYAHSFLKTKEDTQGAVQEIFIKIWLKRDTITQASFKSFIYTITKNQCLNILRKIAQEQKLITEADKSKDTHDPIDRLIREKECMLLLERLLEELPPAQQRVFRMARIQGMSHKEISKKLGISIQTVKNQVSRATSQLSRSYSHIKDKLLTIVFLLFFL